MSYLDHAIAPGTPPATSVRLRLHGEIRLGSWKPFTAEEDLDLTRGFTFRARVGRWISGVDALADGAGAMKWTLFGVIPVAKASGPDITRSSIGRWLLESIRLPPMLLPANGALWNGSQVTLERLGERGTLDLTLDDRGALRALRMPRWGNPAGGPFGYHPFGGVVEEERAFGGFTIPSRLRVGWDGAEFFRAVVDAAEFR